MSLILWLPLNGDIRNQGLDNRQFTLSAPADTTVNDNGKIGKCYNFSATTTADNGIYAADDGFMNKYINNKSFSICAWINTTTTGNTPVVGLSYGLTFYAGNKGQIILSNSSRSVTCASTIATNDGKWHHVIGSYNVKTNAIKYYVDGVLSNTVYYTSGYTYASSWTNGLYIGRNVNDVTLNDGYHYNGKMNDFRVYDHCLSDLEAKQLAQGLAVHYKLDDTIIEPINNLVTKLAAGGRTTLSADSMSVTSNGTSGDTYFRLIISESLVAGETYTLSMMASGMPEGTHWVFCFNNVTSYSFRVYNGYNTYTFVAGSDLVDVLNPLIDDRNSGTANYAITTFSNCQLEKRDHATMYSRVSKNADTRIVDSSGYGNHGVTWGYDEKGTIEVSTSTPRNSLSTLVYSENNTTSTPSGTRYIYGYCPLTTPECLTVAFWCKPIAGYGGATNQGQFSLTNNDIGGTAAADYLTAPMNHRDNIIDINSSDSTVTHIRPSITFTKDEWHHYAITYDGRYGKVYKDGVLSDTKDMGSNKTLGDMKGIVIGFSRAGGVWRSNQTYYSDFRLYVTALSADDVKDLYQSAGHVDESGKFHAYEYVEGHYEC